MYHENSTCFGVFVGNDGNAQLEQNAGYGYFECVRCHSALASGIISDQPDPVTGCFYIAVLHKVSSPNAGGVQPIIFSLDEQAHHFKMDPAATYKDSSATQVPTRTIKDVRKDWIFAKHFLYFINGVDTYEDEE